MTAPGNAKTRPVAVTDEYTYPTRPAKASEPPVNFPIDVLAELRPQAIKRGTSVDRLARDIVEIAALGGLIDAILDDEAAQ